MGEQGSDTGGLTREFFRLVGLHASIKYMEPTGCFKHNSVALIYRYIIINSILHSYGLSTF